MGLVECNKLGHQPAEEPFGGRPTGGRNKRRAQEAGISSLPVGGSMRGKGKPNKNKLRIDRGEQEELVPGERGGQ